MRRNLKKNLFIFIRICVSVGLIAYLIQVVDWNKAITIAREANRFLLFLAPFTIINSFWVSGLRWKLILADNKVPFSIWHAFQGYLIGLTYSIFLPGVLGGDAIRIALCVQRSKASIGTATASVLLERISGIISLFCLLFFVYIVSPQTVGTLLSVHDTKSIAVISAVGLSGIVLIILSRNIWISWFSNLEIKGVFSGIWRFFKTMANTLGTLKSSTLFFVIILAISFQLIDICVTFLLAKSIGIHLPFIVYVGLIPLIYLILLLPISLGGLGLREGALAFLLSRFGVLSSDAVILSFLIYLCRVVIGIFGGGLQMYLLLIKGRITQATQEKS